MNEPKRYEEYPQLARLVRAMSDDGRELVAHWHRVLTTALEGFIPEARRQVTDGMSGAVDEMQLRAAFSGAGAGLQSWLDVMRKVAAIIVDPSEGDWCCKRGMLAHPDPCPQHGFDVAALYDEGTIIEREYGEGKENAVYVRSDEAQSIWRSVQFPLTYSTADVATGRWRVVGHV